MAVVDVVAPTVVELIVSEVVERVSVDTGCDVSEHSVGDNDSEESEVTVDEVSKDVLDSSVGLGGVTLAVKE